jgi:hypothetical protein
MRAIPEPDYGWPTGVSTVSAERVSISTPYVVYRVYADREPVGFVFGRPERPGGRRWWDCLTGETPPGTEEFVRAVYRTDDRRMAMSTVIERSRR